MPDFGAYIDWQEAGDLEEWYREFDRGDGVAFMLGHRGIEITLDRAGTALAAQTMLLAPAGRSTVASQTANEAGISAKEQLLLVAAADADIKRGDRFSYNSNPTGRLNYQIVRVERGIYAMLQCYAEEVQ